MNLSIKTAVIVLGTVATFKGCEWLRKKHRVNSKAIEIVDDVREVESSHYNEPEIILGVCKEAHKKLRYMSELFEITPAELEEYRKEIAEIARETRERSNFPRQ